MADANNTNKDVWADPEAASKRFSRDLVISAAGIAVAALVFGNARVAAGVVLGGGLALLNFRWLAGSVRGIMAIGSKRVPPGTAMKIGLRWIVVAAVGYAGYWTGYFSATGIVIGLLAPAPTVLFESLYLTVKTVVSGQGPVVGGQ
jgi:hypothetical protein